MGENVKLKTKGEEKPSSFLFPPALSQEVSPKLGDNYLGGRRMKKQEKEVEVVKAETAMIESLKEPMALGEIFIKSGMFKDVKSQAQAVVKIIAGKEIGLAPMESMQNIYMTPEGKIGIMAKIVGALIKKSKKYDYAIEKIDETECIIVFSIIEEGKRTEIGKSSFSLKDAAKAGLVNKDNYRNYPRNMNFARALMNGARWYTPDIYCGYAVEEIEDTTPEEIKSTVVSIDARGEVTNGESK